MSFKPIDSSRDEFRKYLERSGVIEALSKVLINLFHEQDRPENAVDYLRINIGDALKDRDTIESLKQELTDARREIEELKKVSTSNTVTVQTNTEGGGGDAPILQSATNASTAAIVPTENLEPHGKSDATSSTQSDNIEKVETKPVIDNVSVTTDKEEIVKAAENDETTDNISSVENNEQQQSPPILAAAAATVTVNDEEPSKDPPKNAE